MIYKYNEATNALEEFENIVFRGGKPKEHKIEVKEDLLYKSINEGELYFSKVDGVLVSRGIPF